MEYAHRISASITTHYKKLMLKRVTKEIADIDRYALFKVTNPSIRPTFFEQRAFRRAAQARVPD